MKLSIRDNGLLRHDAFIGGEWVPADDRSCMDVINPATGEIITSVPRMGDVETRRAIDAAATALPAWSGLTAKARAELLRKWFELILANEDDLAAIMTAEQGKPLTEARGEIRYAASFIEWFAEEAKRIYGDIIPSHKAGAQIVITREPVGVTAAITPWNFPSAMITRKAGPALAAGCTMIVKPASATPLSALALAVLAERAGIPAGVLSIVTGNATRIAGEMTRNPAVRKISFTGSTDIGKQLMAESAGTLKKLSLELGGNAPFIVFDDANIDAAVQGAIASKFRNAGQTCVCTNRFLVQNGVYDSFSRKLVEAVAALKVGDGAEPGVDQGPLIDRAAVDKVKTHIADALAKGARVLHGGEPDPRGGTFFTPTVLADVSSACEVAKEETFGPLAPLFHFSDEADAISQANDTSFGLAAYVYTRDLGRAWRMSSALEYGIVGINEGLISTEVAPFGGMKESGFGREGSKYGIEDYLEIKYTLMGGLQ
ncbi:MAG: NAD-dependent succinate-semialdehyde dehydrogenase [Pseudomonadota bacterium]|nr:NAD-dependent succinate-semialdehyde dehydrogenase [Pseudomonadota bacterium]